jgi:hypothetical protein
VEAPGTTSIYTFSLRQFGRLLCRYHRDGNVSTLILERDPDAEEAMDAIRPKKWPSIGAEAEPKRKRKRD